MTHNGLINVQALRGVIQHEGKRGAESRGDLLSQ